jgi:hypothetical protein
MSAVTALENGNPAPSRDILNSPLRRDVDLLIDVCGQTIWKRQPSHLQGHLRDPLIPLHGHDFVKVALYGERCSVVSAIVALGHDNPSNIMKNFSGVTRIFRGDADDLYTDGCRPKPGKWYLDLDRILKLLSPLSPLLFNPLLAFSVYLQASTGFRLRYCGFRVIFWCQCILQPKGPNNKINQHNLFLMPRKIVCLIWFFLNNSNNNTWVCLYVCTLSFSQFMLTQLQTTILYCKMNNSVSCRIWIFCVR